VSQTDIDRFRRLCGQFRWLAVFMVVSVGALLALATVIAPVVHWARGNVDDRVLATALLHGVPGVCYLYGVWSIGSAMGHLSRGRLIQPTLASTLRRVGVALGVGGVASVFVVINLLRLMTGTMGGYLHFDVAGMTLGMIGGALFLLGGVVEQAGRVQAELDEMI